MPRSRILKWLVVSGGVVVALLAVSPLAVLWFFHYMSKGELSSWPPGGKVTVAFSDGSDVYAVMTDICQQSETPPTLRREAYTRLLESGTIAQVPDGTRIYIEENGDRLGGLRLSSFRFANGPWKGKIGWTCPNSAVGDVPYP